MFIIYILKTIYNAKSLFSPDSQCQPDTRFWTDEFTQCTCIESQLTCAQIACGDGQPCSKAVRSKRSSDSFTSGTCKVTSDLRYTTFDGVKSRFMGHCIHLLTEVCDEAGLLPDFVMEVKTEQIGKSSKVQIQQINLNIQHLRVTLPRRNKRKIMVSGLAAFICPSNHYGTQGEMQLFTESYNNLTSLNLMRSTPRMNRMF